MLSSCERTSRSSFHLRPRIRVSSAAKGIAGKMLPKVSPRDWFNRFRKFGAVTTEMTAPAASQMTNLTSAFNFRRSYPDVARRGRAENLLTTRYAERITRAKSPVRAAWNGNSGIPLALLVEEEELVLETLDVEELELDVVLEMIEVVGEDVLLVEVVELDGTVEVVVVVEDGEYEKVTLE